MTARLLPVHKDLHLRALSVESTCRKISHLRVPVQTRGPVVNLVAQAVAGTINAGVYKVSRLFTPGIRAYGKPFDLPSVLGELLLVVSRDLL